jgi:hypothetical protein
MHQREFCALASLSAFAALFVSTLSAAAQSTPAPAARLSADEVVRNLEAHNLARANALHQFEGTRTYTLAYRGFPNNHDASMVVEMTYQSPSTKQFKVISQTGSKFIIDHVFKRMLESESEAAQDQNKNALNSKNYEFTMIGYEATPQGGQYVLQVSPRTHNKFLYRGKVWIDATDFATVKIEAEPAQNPSLFIRHTDVRHSYKKVDNFWFPAENHTTSYLRIGGHADLSIEYQKYTITAADPIPPVTATVARQGHSGSGTSQ